MLGKHDKQYTKKEWEIIDVMCEESSEKTYCLVHGESLSTQSTKGLNKSPRFALVVW